MKSLFYTIILGICVSSIGWGQRSVREYMFSNGNSVDTNITYVFSIPENEDYDFFVGQFQEPVTYLNNVLDFDKFYVRNDSLFTYYSFDYESPNGFDYFVALNTPRGLDTALIHITDVTDKWDTNDVADADMAQKYDHINAGDYVIWNYTNNQDLDLQLPSLTAGAKVLIHAKEYNIVRLDLIGASGTDTTNRITVTNFLGQVESKGGFELQSPNYVRFTGQFDSNLGTGHRYFTGCDQNASSTDFSFSHGHYGIYANNQWQSEENGTGILIASDNNGVELDHIEIANGYRDAILWFWPGNYSVSEYNYIHHNFIHDIGSDGITIGGGGNFPQQVFRSTIIENNVIARTGTEGLQLDWFMQGCLVRNNFIHTSLDWKDPFAGYQNKSIDLRTIGGGIGFENNIIMGSAKAMANFWAKNNNTPLSYSIDSLYIKNNLNYGSRGDLGYFTHDITDNNTPVVYDGNFFASLGYDLDEVYKNTDTTNTMAMNINTGNVPNIVRNNRYGNDVEKFIAGTASMTLSNNLQTFVPGPDFTNYLDLGLGFKWQRLHRYASTIGSNSSFPSGGSYKGSPASWESGDVVQCWNQNGETRFYRCIQNENTGTISPPTDDTDNSHWQLISWMRPDGTISFYPPDDVRLNNGSYYDLLSMGVRDVLPNGPPPPPPPIPNQPPLISINQPTNGDSISLGQTVNIQLSASDPDGAVFSIRMVLNGQTLTWKYLSPWAASFTPNAVGTYELYATAYDSDNDSTISDTTTFVVYDPTHYLVLHYNEVNAADAGLATVGEAMLNDLGNKNGFTVHHDSTGGTFYQPGQLSKYRVIVFNNTSGPSLFDSIQHANFDNYIQNGGSVVAINRAIEAHPHSTVAGGNWDSYAQSLGASPQASPISTASISGVLDKVQPHITIDHFPKPLNYTGKFYYWENGYLDTANIVSLMEVRSTGGQTYDAARPAIWFQYLTGGGRAYYTSLGGKLSDYLGDKDFKQHILKAIEWTHDNEIPIVTIQEPVDQDTLYADTNIRLLADVVDLDGTIDSVRFSVNGQKLNTVLQAPWQINYLAKVQGNLTIIAQAYDNRGGIGSDTTRIAIRDTTTPDTAVMLTFSVPENEDYDYAVGPIPSYVTGLLDTLAYKYFYVARDTLWTMHSWDYENTKYEQRQYSLEFTTTGPEVKATINITDVTGKWDTDGFADADIAAKYPMVQVGDYIYFNRNGSGGIYDKTPDYANVISYPNRVVIHGGHWGRIQMFLNGVHGTSTKKPIIFTNFLGQVEHEGVGFFESPSNIRLTGEYDPVKRTGHRYYRGTTDSLYFSQATFGFVGMGKWEWEGSGINVGGGHGYAIHTTGTSIELDHVEAMEGFFSGINFKKDNAGGVISDSNHVHHCYIHDIGSEGGYFGNTKGPPQQIFTNFKIHDNAFIRCGGEGAQNQRVGDGFEFKNNVMLINGMDWKDAFQRYQDGALQEHAQGGKQHIHSNISIASGEGSSKMRMRKEQSGYSHPNDTIFFYNNFFAFGRGDLGQYIYQEHDGKTSYIMEENWYCNYGAGNVNEVYNENKGKATIFRAAVDGSGQPNFIFEARKNHYDTTFFQVADNSNVVVTKNVQQNTLPLPQFIEFLGTSNHVTFTNSFDYTHLERYCNIVGSSNAFIPGDAGKPEFSGISRKGYPAWWEVGDIAQYWNNKGETRFYLCIQADNTSTDYAPSQDDTKPNNSHWKMLWWTKPDGTRSYYPPDNVHLVPGSHYELLGLGLTR